ncbi:DUF389 domain-containing protein [Arthrobacter sp. FW306-05-C]|uniref:DUF389 domain-containing protein n=1 Tax=unclassified Arthrobacter TaxID=235627 RepID=UPI001EF07A19|nr:MULTISPECIES: DUF389 domain-containing protein [unclassified Arthrobacter]UKA65618.1 DUF389 domain-containing protein [Arthrobacter sp. FW306-05-C]UKA69985.1 DUF389 domain-containing protein [Arthrobacter sp. FW306-06-A]UKA74283.1 DUF389 domain-containing protein [Arthrobacter sp. FW306-07-I]
MVVQLRICVPGELSEVTVQTCRDQRGVAEVMVAKGAAVVPPGDVIEVFIARESVEELLEKLDILKIQEAGSIAMSTPEFVLSRKADQAERSAPGDGADAVIWDDVTRQTGEDSRLTWNFLAFLVLATQLAGIGIVTDSPIAIVGAMAVGPEFGPLAALAVSLATRQWKLGRRAAVALGVGFPVAMLLAALTAWLSVPLGLFPRDALDKGSAVEFIYHPGPYSLIVAVLAGIAGMLSIIGRRSAALIGVFISVTTVPAAGYVAVALVLGEYQKAAGSALQLLLNLVGIVVAALAVLLFYRVVARRLPDGAARRLQRQRSGARR